MIEVKIDGKVYNEEQFKKDYGRMIDSLRENDVGYNCYICPLQDKICLVHDNESTFYESFRVVETVYKWAKEQGLGLFLSPYTVLTMIRTIGQQEKREKRFTALIEKSWIYAMEREKDYRFFTMYGIQMNIRKEAERERNRL